MLYVLFVAAFHVFPVWRNEKSLISRNTQAANTIFLFLGYQKYLSAFPTGRIIAKAMLAGFADILCFFVVMVVLLMGYVSMGHTIFGTIMIDFSTLGYSLITCFQMFLGTFRSFAAMRQANGFAYYFYWYSYMVLFRYVLVNMFFAIVAKHFQREDQEYKEQKEQQQQVESHEVAPRLSLVETVKSAAKSLVSGVWSKDGTERMEEETDAGIESIAGEDVEVLSTPRSQGRGIDTPMSIETETVDDSFITPDMVDEANWKFLPDETRQWAVEKAKEIFRFIQEKSRLREKVEAQPNPQHFDIDHIQEEAEASIQENAFNLGKKAEKVKMDLSKGELRSLKVVHRDQESLAWYIMKRETELKKLEEAKTVMQERYENLVNATQSLIATEEEPNT